MKRKMKPQEQTNAAGTLSAQRRTYWPRSPQATLEWVLGLTVLPYFLVRGWLTAAVALLGLFCLASVVSRRAAAIRTLADPRVAWMVAAFTAPLLAVLVVQTLRLEFVARSFDAPLRFFLGGFILMHLVERRADFLRFAPYALPIAVFLCAALLLYPGASAYFWSGRVASYFMDPLTLAQHVMIVGFMCLFLADAQGKEPLLFRLTQYGAFFVALAIMVWTHSRTAWLMVPFLAGIWFIGFKRTPRLGLALALVAAAGAGLYLFPNVVHDRVGAAIQETVDYFAGGSRETSVGVRLSLLQAHWALFMASPLYGWGFQNLPPISSIPGVAAFFTPLFEHYYLHSGGHNELLESAMRMGVFGLVSRLMLFLVPLAIFIRAAGAVRKRQRAAGYLGLTVVIGYTTAGFTSEVFNLLYTASFYVLLVAALAASAIHEEQP